MCLCLLECVCTRRLRAGPSGKKYLDGREFAGRRDPTLHPLKPGQGRISFNKHSLIYCWWDSHGTVGRYRDFVPRGHVCSHVHSMCMWCPLCVLVGVGSGRDAKWRPPCSVFGRSSPCRIYTRVMELPAGFWANTTSSPAGVQAWLAMNRLALTPVCSRIRWGSGASDGPSHDQCTT